MYLQASYQWEQHTAGLFFNTSVWKQDRYPRAEMGIHGLSSSLAEHRVSFVSLALTRHCSDSEKTKPTIDLQVSPSQEAF